MKKFLATIFTTVLFAQYDYATVDLNSTSATYLDSVGPSYYNNSVILNYFGYFS